MNLRPTPLVLMTALAAGFALSSAALAQSADRPWYVGVVQDFTHETNVFGGPAGTEVSDTVSTTTLRGGLNLPFGRQRAYANAALNHQRYSDLAVRNNNGYSLGAGLEWSTIERLSGSFTLNANRQPVDFNVGGILPLTLVNLERSEDFRARVRLGVVTMLAFEAEAGHRQVSFSAPEFAPLEYKQDSGSLGVSYRPSAILSLGVGVSAERTLFGAPTPGQTDTDKSQRQEAYVTAHWVPTGASTVDARLAFGKTEYDRAVAANFEGITGSLAWLWKPTGLLTLTTTLSRDTGQESGFLRLTDGSTVTATDFSRVTNALTVLADYELTGKVTLIGGVAYAQRNLVDGFTGVGGSDKTSTLSLGVRWAATRTIALGCNASRESRTAAGAGSSDFDNDRIGCFGQITLD